MELEIIKLDPLRVAAFRHVGPYEDCHKAWEKLFKWAGQTGLFDEETKVIGVSYDDPDTVPAEKLRYDACITVDDDFEGENEFDVMEIPGGRYARYIHIGKFNLIGASFKKIFKELLPQSGNKCKHGPCLEIYIDDPEDVPEEKCRTELLIPVK